MKVLQVLYSGLGGHGNVFFSMVDANDDNNIEFEALFNGIEDVKEEYIQRCIQKNITIHFVKKKPGIDIWYYIKLYRHIKKAAPQIIFLHGGAAALPAKLAKITSSSIKKIVVRETQANHLKTTIDWIYLATAMLVADKMVYLSNEYKQQVQKKLSWLYSKKNSVVIPNGINLATFTKTKVKQQPAIIMLGMQSRLIKIKDHLTLLDAFKTILQQSGIPLLHLNIAGDGDFKQTLVQRTKDLGIADKVTFTGMLEEKELVSFLHGVDIYIHASLGETMSTAIMQAMACGKPIIASDVPGINNMIANKVTGFLVPAKNATAMAEALVALINNPLLGNQLGANAFNFAEANYSNTKMLDNYKAIFSN